MKKTALILAAVIGLTSILSSTQAVAKPTRPASTAGMRFCKKNESPIIIVNGNRVQVCRSNWDLTKGEMETVASIAALANGDPKANIAKCEASNRTARQIVENEMPLLIEKITELSGGLYRLGASNIIINETKNGIGKWDRIQEIKSLNGPINSDLKLYYSYKENNSPANLANNGVIKSIEITSRINIKKTIGAKYISRTIYSENRYADNSWKDGLIEDPSPGTPASYSEPCDNHSEVEQSRLLMIMQVDKYADGSLRASRVYGLPIGNNEALSVLERYVLNKDPYRSLFSNPLSCPDNRLFDSGECKIGWYIAASKLTPPTSANQPKVQYSGKGYLGVQTEIRGPQTQYRPQPDGSNKQVKIVGATVIAVSPGSPADLAGVQVGDIIETVQSRFGTKAGFGYTGTGFLPIDDVVAEVGAGFPIKLGIVRGWQDLSLDIVLGNMPTKRETEGPAAAQPLAKDTARDPTNSEWLLALSIIDKLPKRSDYWILKVAKGVSETFGIGDTVGQTDNKGELRAKGRAVYIDSPNKIIIVDRVEGAYFADSDLLSVTSESQARSNR